MGKACFYCRGRQNVQKLYSWKEPEYFRLYCRDCIDRIKKEEWKSKEEFLDYYSNKVHYNRLDDKSKELFQRLKREE
ncbi:hypothetical protein CFK37_18925 [Virgibacillus phasianinus]|uniref:Uncharacterized protein n=1 Tax=Virgibacillus phasianinus TaxID=2017483 RepID=A0A220U7G4_9BACI|nr:hypothetical protein CFK37_18925 [Virgibacillus phasianinus]